MSTYIMHRLAVELRTVLGWTLAARWRRPTVALAIVETMINVSVETARPVVPRSCTDEQTAPKPFRAIVAVWSAGIRRGLVVPIWTNRGLSNAERNLRLRFVSGSH